MNRIRKLLSLVFLFGIAFEMLSDIKTINYSLTMEMADVRVSTVDVNGTNFSTVSIADLTNSAADNEPTLPVKFVSFQVPTYCNNIFAKIVSSRLEGSLFVEYPLLPGLNVPSRSDFTLEPGMYATTGQGYIFPNELPVVTICDEFFVNGNDHIVTLGIYPAAYNHGIKELKFYSDIKVELGYELCGKSDMKFTPFEDDNVKLINVARLVENPNDFEKQRIGSYTDNNTTVTLKNYVILVPENLKEYVSRLAKWKEQKGYKVKIQTIEDILKDASFAIGSSAKCFDKESSVREWLKYYKKQINAAFFCLIIGDYRTSAPIRKFYSPADIADDRDPENPNSEDYSPTDAYFSDLTTDWSLKMYQCGLYSCDISSANFSPTIPVGRLLCTTGDEIERYTDKLLLYELFPGRGDTDYLTKGFVFQEYDAQSWRSKTIFDDLPEFSITLLKDNYASEFSKSTPTGKDVISSMNKKGILSWQGHGDPISIECAKLNNNTTWPSKHFILAQSAYRNFNDRYNHENQNGLDCMTNYDYPSIAYSLSCNITPFDAFQGAWDRFDNEYNMGSAFTVAGDYGGVALLGNTRVGYFTDSSYMEQQFGKHLLENSCIGIAELYSKTSISNQNSIYVKRIKFRHNIIGEPEFNIWTAKPMSFNGTSAISDKMFRLSGSCITKGFYGIASKSTVSQTEYNVSNHSLSISLSNALTNSQIATVYVWQNNYLPLTQIVTTGKEIVNENREIFLTKAIFSADAISGKSYSMGEHPTYLNVGKNSNISINALDNISSDGGMVIQNQGSLSLNTKRINLKNDKVEAGGSLNVKAHGITLEAGVSVEAGATAYFSPY